MLTRILFSSLLHLKSIQSLFYFYSTHKSLHDSKLFNFTFIALCLTYRSTEDERFAENDQCQKWLERWETQALKTPGLTLKERRKIFLSDKTKFDVYSMITGFKVYCRTLFTMYRGSNVSARNTNQDKLENFFGEQRAVNGQTTNPTILETGKIYMLVIGK